MNIWTEKMVERGDGAAYSQRLEEELLSLSQRDLNVSNNNPTSIAGLTTKKRKKNGTSILRGARTSREEEDEEVGDDDDDEEEEEEEENEAVGIDERALHAKLTAFLKSSRDVYATILRMEPIDIDEVKKLCENGLRMKCISKVKLANYFDSKGVAVRHNAPKKKKKKTTTTTNKQTTPSGRIENELPNHNGETRAARVGTRTIDTTRIYIYIYTHIARRKHAFRISETHFHVPSGFSGGIFFVAKSNRRRWK